MTAPLPPPPKATSANSVITIVFISIRNQMIFLPESIQILISIILNSEGRSLYHLYLLHNLSLRLHSNSIRVMRLSSPIATRQFTSALDRQRMHRTRENNPQGLSCSEKNKIKWASLVAQWLRVCLPMYGTRVRALVWEDPTCRGATRPVSHNY